MCLSGNADNIVMIIMIKTPKNKIYLWAGKDHIRQITGEIFEDEK